ncbi:hypothetical protein HDU76_013251 [Blyttiomyces sp. JEL0837]|nr:hypothetical protein HDU76_013251 [Blyttiomyces sp. JEL0837]
MSPHHHDHDHTTTCGCSKTSTPYTESLDEMDFARSLHGVAYSGDIQKVAKYLSKSNINVNELDNAGYTPLHYAARQGKLEICKLLIQHGADVNIVTKGLNTTALYRACMGGHIGVVKYLLDKNADVNIVSSDGGVALLAAVESGNIELVKILTLRPGIRFDVRDRNGESALDVAIRKGVNEIVGLLKECCDI